LKLETYNLLAVFLLATSRITTFCSHHL